MKTKNITGNGIVGNKVVLNVVDMVTLSMLADRVEKVQGNHDNIAEYNAMPYDKRVDENGKLACPKRIELEDEDLQNIAIFLRKCAGSFSNSTLFDPKVDCEIRPCDDDEPEYNLLSQHPSMCINCSHFNSQ